MTPPPGRKYITWAAVPDPMDEEQEWFSLSDGETVVWWGQPRIWRIAPQVVTSVVGVAAFLAVAIVGPQYAPGTVPAAAVTGVGLALALASLAPGVLAYLRTRNVYYVLTSRDVYRKRGVWSTNVARVAVTDVQNTRLSKSVRGTLFGYGSVAISTAGSGDVDLVFTDLDSPETFRNELQRVRSEARTTGAATGSADRPASSTTAQSEAPTSDRLDPDALDRVIGDARALRESAERLETEVSSG